MEIGETASSATDLHARFRTIVVLLRNRAFQRRNANRSHEMRFPAFREDGGNA
jgi:hypothetical protein